jgi:hypothetical protein
MTRDEIDKMDYEQMLRRWRFTPSGDPTFADSVLFEHFKQRMSELKEKCDHVAISKRIGFDSI